MIIENPASLQFFITEDIYLVKKDTEAIGNYTPESTTITPEVVPAMAEVTATPPPAPPVIETPPLSFKYLGKNQKNFLVVFHSNGAGKFDDKHFEALKNTLLRKGLALDDTAIIDINEYPETNTADVTAYFKPTQILLLGKQCLLPGWDNLALNTLTRLDNYTALHTYAFDEMMADREKVKAFWDQMKVL